MPIPAITSKVYIILLPMKVNSAIFVLACAIWLCVATACSGVPDDVLSQQQMAELLADIHTGEAVVETNSSSFRSDSAKYRLKLAIYKRHGVTSEQVDSSLSWYGYHMDKYVEVYDKVAEILQDRLLLAEEKAGDSGASVEQTAFAMEGDSVDVWMGVRSRRFATEMPSDIVSFSFSSDPNWERGDIYTFRGKMLQNDTRGVLSLAMEYSDGYLEYLTKPLIGDGWHEVRIAADSSRVLRDIYGSLVYTPTPGHVTYIDSVSFTRTRWKPDKAWVRQEMKHLNKKRYAH